MTSLIGTPKQKSTKKAAGRAQSGREEPQKGASLRGRKRRQVWIHLPFKVLTLLPEIAPVCSCTGTGITLCPAVSLWPLIGADKPGDCAIERASAAPNLATAPHDGPDEPLLLHHDPTDGT